MSYKADSIIIALGYLEEARIELAKLKGANPTLWTDFIDMKIKHAADRVRNACEVTASEPAIVQIAQSQQHVA